MTRKSLLRLVIILLISFFIFIIHSAISIWSFSKQNQFVQTDAAIVLGAAVWHDEPSPVFRERITHAITLYENDYVEKIIFTGGKGKGSHVSEAEVAKAYAIKHDVHPDDILIETKSKITEENLIYAHEIASEKDLNTFTIVSDPLHMKRAMLMAKTIGIEEIYSSPTQTSAYKTVKSQIPFFLRELVYYVGYKFSFPFK
ncbi:YdcF family protein [Metabacillus malikii]|uniref:Uncharacterized SAM-binding protein YcdF (DUF218 family) n=1 Tax=Metabacillus malikii TaxID=1504265 RepID=A0ABT9ZFZ8_9BACI|nr:YdcF family protein [Metabacillus malikii]MDQ0230180.1 uncharacterized SAM-binding protein YcdF (DUF218 family) [Metabacillus malikii]